MKEQSPAVKKAINLLRGQDATPEGILKLSKELKGEKAFNYARRILSLACNDRNLTKEPGLYLAAEREDSMPTF